MTRGGYCSHSLIILTVLAKRIKLNKIDKYYDHIEKKSRTTLKKPNEN